jgi:hypothetical protein
MKSDNLEELSKEEEQELTKWLENLYKKIQEETSFD